MMREQAIPDLKQKIDKLSPRAKRWLQHAASALGESEPYINHVSSKEECSKAGLIVKRPFGRIEISGEIMELIEVQGYLRNID